jgi:hypothetical protein
MLASKRFPEILRSILSDGVDGAILMTIEGSVLASDINLGPESSPILSETVFAAISSSIWHSYNQGERFVCPELLYVLQIAYRCWF